MILNNEIRETRERGSCGEVTCSVGATKIPPFRAFRVFRCSNKQERGTQDFRNCDACNFPMNFD